MSFDFTPVKAFLSAEIASIDAFRAKLVQVLSFFPDSSDQLSPDPVAIPVAPPVVTSVPSPPASTPPGSSAPPTSDPSTSITPPSSSAPPMSPAPDSSAPPSYTTIPAS